MDGLDLLLNSLIFLVVLIVLMVLIVVIAKKTRFITFFFFLFFLSNGLYYLSSTGVLTDNLKGLNHIGAFLDQALNAISLPLATFHSYLSNALAVFIGNFLNNTEPLTNFLTWDNYFMLIIYGGLFLICLIFVRKKKKRKKNLDNSRYND